ncbi:MAG: Druantia anti-phage system protein DruA [Candidatus Nanohaloarchaea archaeon]
MSEQDFIEFDPDLDDGCMDSFEALVDELIRNPDKVNMEVAIKDEKKKLEGKYPDDISEEEIKYLAVLELLLDLVEVGYNLQREDSTLQVIPPNREKNPEKYKEAERKALRKEQMVQFKDDGIRSFIREMESGNASKEGVPVNEVIADGEDLFNDLDMSDSDDKEKALEEVCDEVEPYVEVADRSVDEETGIEKYDIWRYFRLTWLTPYNTVPGRELRFLIRDASRKHHPVMGIASLGSPIMNIAVRDDYIAWNLRGLKDRLRRKKKELEYEEQLPKSERTEDKKTRTVTRTKYLETEEEYKERKEEVASSVREASRKALERSIGDIRKDDFIEEYGYLSEESFEQPDEKVFEVLDEIFDEAEEKISDPDYEDENPEKLDDWEKKSETPLFRKKRSRTLSKLLGALQYFKENKDKDDLEFIEDAVNEPDGRSALKKALKEQKKEKVGANMMNINVCGAVPPYNEILGGKLVAMAMTGPKVIEKYKEKYSGQVSKIASSMKGEAKSKSNELAFLDTTSLFEVGSAQYSRIRVPADNGTIEYENIGKTKGMGSVQFGPDTREKLSLANEIIEGREKVRGRFGEGVGPRMRKIKNGLKNLGLSTELLRHDSPRIVFAIDLASNAKEYLRGEDEEVEYYWDMDRDPEKAQKDVYQHWKERWLSKRVLKEDIMERLKEFDEEEILLSEKTDFNQKQLSDFIVEGI